MIEAGSGHAVTFCLNDEDETELATVRATCVPAAPCTVEVDGTLYLVVRVRWRVTRGKVLSAFAYCELLDDEDLSP